MKKSDKHATSPYNTNTLSSEQVMGIDKFITEPEVIFIFKCTRNCTVARKES